MTHLKFYFFSVKTPIKGLTNHSITLFSAASLTQILFVFSNATYRVYRSFDEFLESAKKFQKSSHGQKLSEKSYEKVNAR